MNSYDPKRILCRLSQLDEKLDFSGIRSLPTERQVIEITETIISLIFRGLSESSESSDLKADRLFLLLTESLFSSLVEEQKSRVEQCAYEIIEQLPSIKASLILDAIAIYEGDPAATHLLEVMICYPGFYAIMIHRISHLFYNKKIPYIPRIMSEYAHRRTGIDIHPGAEIGESFCIDHGTGIVIGETAEIGDRVKIYQGVTIGAKSFEKDENGRLIKGKKRHPTIGNDCVIYAGATILGGDTVIGDGCIIGGNVWLTHSLASGEKIYYDNYK